MKGYKRYVLGLLVCFMAYGLVSSSASAFWGFGKSKKENNANYVGAVANVKGGSKIATSTISTITVISPNGGEILEAGQSYTIKWTSKNIQKDGVLNIAVVEKETGVNNYIASNIKVKKNKYAWKIPHSIASGEYKIRVFCTIKDSDYGCSSESKDESDNFFMIKIEQPQITVISPNGGEKWAIGQTKEIKWKTKNIPVDSIISLEIFEEGTDKELSTSIYHGLSATTTSYKWKVGGYIIEAGKRYQIIVKVVPVKGGEYFADISDKSFLVLP